MSDEGVSPRESATHSDTTVRLAGLMSEKICPVVRGLIELKV